MRGFLVLFILFCVSIYSTVYYDEIKTLESSLPGEIYSAFHRLFITPPIDISTNEYYRDPSYYPEWWKPPLSVYDAILHLGFEITVIYAVIIMWTGCGIVVFVGETIKSLLP